jgi:hypothetical protein
MQVPQDQPPRVADATEFRADFIRRLFAVAVSVGFAAHIQTLTWIASPVPLPDTATIEHSCLLIIAMATVVASWEIYLRSITRHPLVDESRFILDIVIVFEYLILMTLNARPIAFTWWMFVIFSTYLIWDYLRVLAFRDKYNARGLRTALYPFIRGWWSGSADYKGPSITLWWTIYFLLLGILADFNSAERFAMYSLLILWGIVLYRTDKKRRLGWSKKFVFAVPAILLAALFHPH